MTYISILGVSQFLKNIMSHNSSISITPLKSHSPPLLLPPQGKQHLLLVSCVLFSQSIYNNCRLVYAHMAYVPRVGLACSAKFFYIPSWSIIHSSPGLTFFHHWFVLFVLEVHVDAVIQYVLLCVWLHLLNIMVLRLIHLGHAAVVHSFLLLSNKQMESQFVYSFSW